MLPSTTENPPAPTALPFSSEKMLSPTSPSGKPLLNPKQVSEYTDLIKRMLKAKQHFIVEDFIAGAMGVTDEDFSYDTDDDSTLDDSDDDDDDDEDDDDESDDDESDDDESEECEYSDECDNSSEYDYDSDSDSDSDSEYSSDYDSDESDSDEVDDEEDDSEADYVESYKSDESLEEADQERIAAFRIRVTRRPSVPRSDYGSGVNPAAPTPEDTFAAEDEDEEPVGVEGSSQLLSGRGEDNFDVEVFTVDHHTENSVSLIGQGRGDRQQSHKDCMVLRTDETLDPVEGEAPPTAPTQDANMLSKAETEPCVNKKEVAAVTEEATASISVSSLISSFESLSRASTRTSVVEAAAESKNVTAAAAVSPRSSALGTMDLAPQDADETSAYYPDDDPFGFSFGASPVGNLMCMVGGSDAHFVSSLDVQDYFIQHSQEQIAAYDSRLISAVRRSDVAEISRLHEGEGHPLQVSNEYGETILHMACRRGSLEMIMYLVEIAGVSLRVRDDYGRTPLHDACWTAKPQTELLSYLVNREPDMLFMKDARGYLPLGYTRHKHWHVWNAFLCHNRETILSRKARGDT